jgi:hypothetical protein
MKGLLILCFFVIALLPGYSQKGYEIGIMAGVSYYTGDINPNYSLKTPGPALGFVSRYDFNTRTAIRFDLGAGWLVGKDKLSENSFQKARNLSFKTDYITTSLDFEFNFFNYVHGSRNQYFTPYIVGGLALTYFNPRAKLDDTWYGLRDLGTEGQGVGDEYSLISPSLSYGFGLKMDFNYEWSFNVELSARPSVSDYLDDVSTTYPNMNQLAARRGDIAVRLSDRSPELGIEPIGAQGRQRGVSGDKDSYYMLRVGIVYYIGFLQCPDISKPRP